MLNHIVDSYRVNVDVDVPLFLPLSGQRRMADLRFTAVQEKLHNFRINGQVNFESGWEFGFYLSNAITARAVWNPRMEIKDDWEAYRTALTAVLTPFGDYAAPLRELIIKLAASQLEVMVLSKVKGQAPADLTKLSGHAYMSGADSWVDLERMLG